MTKDQTWLSIRINILVGPVCCCNSVDKFTKIFFKQTRCRLGEVKLSPTDEIYGMIICECIYRAARRSENFGHG